MHTAETFVTIVVIQGDSAAGNACGDAGGRAPIRLGGSEASTAVNANN